MREYEPEYFELPENPVAAAGRSVLLRARNAGRGLLILGESFLWIIHVFKRWQEVRRQLFLCSVKSFVVTATVALFTGMILSLQAGLVFRDYGQEVNVGTLVAQTMCREMGPFMTALILAASVGSAMAAELGTMAVSEEIDALRVMSINPARYLVMPRLVAFMIMLPALTVYTNVLGITGGMVVAYTQLQVAPSAYYYNALSLLANKEVYVGLLKSWVFSIIIVGIACYQGLSATEGAIGVGRATRTTVVHSFLLILIVGYIVTRLFY